MVRFILGVRGVMCSILGEAGIWSILGARNTEFGVLQASFTLYVASVVDLGFFDIRIFFSYVLRMIGPSIIQRYFLFVA